MTARQKHQATEAAAGIAFAFLICVLFVGLYVVGPALIGDIP